MTIDSSSRIHIWSLETYGAHPLAKEPVLRTEGTSRVHMTELGIAHDLFALAEWTKTVTITIWNWKTGTLILVSQPLPLRACSVPY